MAWWMLIFGILTAIFAMLGFGAFNVSELTIAMVFKLLTGVFFALMLILVVSRIVRSIE